MFSRRDFFKRASMIIAAATAAGTVAELDTDKLLYVQGAKRIFLPAPSFASIGIPHHGQTLRDLAVLSHETAEQMYRRAVSRHHFSSNRRYEVVTRDQDGGVSTVEFDSCWRPIEGKHFSVEAQRAARMPSFETIDVKAEAMTPEALQTLDAAMRDPNSRHLGAFCDIAPPRERYEVLERGNPTSISNISDSDSRPGEYTLYDGYKAVKTVKGT